MPELDELTKFVKRKAVLLENTEQKVVPNHSPSASNSRSFAAVSSVKCPMCKGADMPRCCEDCTKLDARVRLSKAKVYFNGLNRRCGMKSCNSKFSCH